MEQSALWNRPELHIAVLPGADQSLAVGEKTQAVHENLVSEGVRRTDRRTRRTARCMGGPGRPSESSRSKQAHQTSSSQFPAVPAVFYSGDARGSDRKSTRLNSSHVR